MVLSRLHPSVQYKELKELYDDDVDMDTNLYAVFFPNMRLKLTVAIGKPRHTESSKNIIFFPLYLIDGEVFIKQIGVYEIYSHELQSIIDDDDNVDISMINRDPLLYSFSVQDSLKAHGSYADDIDENSGDGGEDKDAQEGEGEGEYEEEDDGEALEDAQEDEGNEEENEEEEDVGESVEEEDGQDVLQTDTGKKRDYMSILGRRKYMSIFVDNIQHQPTPPLPDETTEDAANEKSVFKEKLSTTWIEKFMKNNNYTISRTTPDGNCFFQVLRDAFETIGKKTTIEKLRNVFSETIDEETYMMYKEKYNMFRQSYSEDSVELKQLKDEISSSKAKYKMTRDRKSQGSLEKHIEEQSHAMKILVDGMDTTKEMMNEFGYMEKIGTLDEFKHFITTPKFWADTLTISALERELNIKIIILSQESYDTDDKDNVITCGQLNGDQLTEIGKFEPSYYIIMQFSGDHYDLIGYKSKFALQFKEIPYDLKKLIVMKCLEKSSGPYNLIPEFKDMKSMYDSKIIHEETKFETEDNLFNDSAVFQIYHNSNDKPFPGKGSGETLNPDDPETRKKYAELVKIINWRRKLANTHVEPFLLKGKNWSSVEHYIQAQKFKKTPELYDQFTIESKSTISEDPIKARDAGTKKTYFKDKYKVDSDFSSKLSEYLVEALEAKFAHEYLKTILLATKDAKIVSFARANTPPVMTELMEVRKSMS